VPKGPDPEGKISSTVSFDEGTRKRFDQMVRDYTSQTEHEIVERELYIFGDSGVKLRLEMLKLNDSEFDTLDADFDELKYSHIVKVTITMLLEKQNLGEDAQAFNTTDVDMEASQEEKILKSIPKILYPKWLQLYRLNKVPSFSSLSAPLLLGETSVNGAYMHRSFIVVNGFKLEPKNFELLNPFTSAELLVSFYKKVNSPAEFVQKELKSLNLPPADIEKFV
jgi:hypothetical protein